MTGADSRHQTTRQEHEPEPTPLFDDFEQHRAISAARISLFGSGPEVVIGRYAVERWLGAGSMGEVYRAIDRELGRRVAVKRMRPELVSAREHDRLRAEARALARLSHPNVVQIYEVGEHEGQTFVAMEYVEGTNLREWLRTPRSWQTILTAYVEAGRGLAAAHAAGLVHRDFKPDNVLVGNDRRVRVADFGLALDPTETGHTFELAGTIRYMSLEQLRGDPVDSHSDQFSFCVALYEALWSVSPFALDAIADRIRALEQDRPASPPRGSRAPARLWTLIRRGLMSDPERRWASLDELIDALEAIPARRRRQATTVGVVLAALGFGGLIARDGLTEDTCAGVPAELADVWSPERRAELEARFEALPVAHAQASATRVGDRLDQWASAWIDTRTQQCRAAATRRDSPSLVRARRGCLERQRSSVSAMVSILRETSVEIVDRAIEASATLPEPSACAAAVLLDEPEPPLPEQAPMVEQTSKALAALRAQRLLGRGDPQMVEDSVARARELGYRPLLAEALVEQGLTELEAGSPTRGLDALDEAAKLALALGHRRLVARTLTTLAIHRLGEYPSAEAAFTLDLAEAAWTDLEPDPGARARLAYGLSRLADDDDRARALLVSALPEALPTQRPALLGALAALAKGDEALALHEHALEESTAAFGPAHPKTAEMLFNVGVALREQNITSREHRDHATALLERAAEIWTQAYGAPHPNLGRAHHMLATTALEAGDYERAESHALETAEIHSRTLPPNHRDLGIAPMLLGRIAAGRGDRARALELARQALEVYEQADGPYDFAVLEMRLDVAASELGLDHLDAATREYRRVLEQARAPELTSLAYVGLAEAELRRGDLERARALLDEVETIGVSALASQHISYLIIEALIELRRGCDRCGPELAARIASSMTEWGWTIDMLGGWIEELRATPEEVEQLGLQ